MICSILQSLNSKASRNQFYNRGLLICWQVNLSRYDDTLLEDMITIELDRVVDEKGRNVACMYYTKQKLDFSRFVGCA